MRYADSNVQAWAQYYAQGGKDPTGAVYFISVPGVKEAVSPQPTPQSTTATTADPNLTSSLSRKQSLLHNPHGGTNGSLDADDLTLENPYDKYGAGQGQTPGGATNPGYGVSPYYGLTRDMAGMDIKG